MKFSVEREDMLKACQLAASPVKRGRIPVYDHILIRGFDAHLTIQGASADVTAAAKCKAAVAEAGSSSAVAADDLLSAIDAVTISGCSRVRFDCGDDLVLSGDGFLSGTREATAVVRCDVIAPFRQCFSAHVIRKALSPFSGRVVTFGAHREFGHWQITAEGAPLVLAMGLSDATNAIPVAA